MDLRLNFVENRQIRIEIFNYLIEFMQENKKKIGMLQKSQDFFVHRVYQTEALAKGEKVANEKSYPR